MQGKTVAILESRLGQQLVSRRGAQVIETPSGWTPFTNAAQVYNLFSVAKRDGRIAALRAGLDRALVASIGPVCSDALRKFGVTIGLASHPPKLGPLVSALEAALTH